MKISHMLGALGLALCLWANPVLADQDRDQNIQFLTGRNFYEDGDYVNALRTWHPLAEKGYADAQVWLGFMYLMGKAVPQNYAEALKWFRLAADQGDAQGQYSLGGLYAKGWGVPQNYAEAAKWRRLSAEQGYTAAQSALADMYFTGEGVPQDYMLSYMWLIIASVEGSDPDIVANRDWVATKLTPDQIAKAQSLAQEWVTAHKN